MKDESNFAPFHSPAPRRTQKLNHDQVRDGPGRIRACRERRSRAKIKAHDLRKLLPVLAISFVVRMFIGVHAPVGVLVVMLEDLVEKNAEAMFLCVVETVIERLGRIGDFVQFGAAGRKVFRAELKALNQVALLVMLFRFLTPFDRAGSSIFGDVAKRVFERRPILFLRRRQFQSGFQRGDTRIGKGGFLFR